MTFYLWLKKQINRDTVVGDFARDAMRTQCCHDIFNQQDNDPEKIQGHLILCHGACEEALDAFSQAWRAYRRQS